MNSLNQNPKKNMFYAAAQNMLNQQSNQQSLVNMRINHFLAQFTPQNRIDSSLNHSDRNNYLKFQEKDRSLSNLNKSLNNSLETKHNYNLKKFQMIHEDPNLLQQKEVQKLEQTNLISLLKKRLKDYLQKQIDENRKFKQAQQELEKIEDQKAEQRYLKQLKDLKDLKKPEVQQFQIPIKNLPIYSNVPDGPFLSIYRNSSNEGSNALQKLTSIQNDLLLLQTAKNISVTNINDVRQQIKQMIKKQVTPKDNIYPKNQYDRILPTETEYIPVNQQLEVADQQQILQQSKPATAKAQESIRKPETAQKNSSFHGSQLLQNSHLSISQITAREKSRSKSKDKMFRSNSKDKLDSLLFPNRESQKSQKISSQKEIPDITNKSFASLKAQKQNEEKQLKLVKMKQPTIPHRTSMLMQIPQKNVKQEESLRSNYHKIS